MMLELRDIYKTYLQGRLEVPVLNGISLSVEEGEYLAIMGPSGSGKTTLMNIIGCLDNPTSGDYILDGENIAQLSEKRMSEVRLHSIGFVFQSFYLLSKQSALENVALPLLYAGVRRRDRLDIARQALERVGLDDRTDFTPTQLSGGQCQRVAIARAIVNNPKILLADEPTGALDTRSGEQIMEIFQRLNDEGVTVVMITHEQEIAAHAKRTLHIRDGLLVGGEKHTPPQRPAVPAQAGPAPMQRNPMAAKPEPVRTFTQTRPAPLQKPTVPAQAGPAPAQRRPVPAKTGPVPVYTQIKLAPAQKPSIPPQAVPGPVPVQPKPFSSPTQRRPMPAKTEPVPVYTQIKPAPTQKPAAPGQPEPIAAAPVPEPHPSVPDPEPISGQSVIAALQRQLDQLSDQEDAREEGPNHEQ